jgi:hypothetical protein
MSATGTSSTGLGGLPNGLCFLGLPIFFLVSEFTDNLVSNLPVTCENHESTNFVHPLDNLVAQLWFDCEHKDGNIWEQLRDSYADAKVNLHKPPNPKDVAKPETAPATHRLIAKT